MHSAKRRLPSGLCSMNHLFLLLLLSSAVFLLFRTLSVIFQVINHRAPSDSARLLLLHILPGTLRLSCGSVPDLHRFLSGLVLVHGDQIRLHVLILFIKNEIPVQRRGITVFKKSPCLFFVEGHLANSALKGKVSAFHQLPARFLFCRAVNKIIGNFSFLLPFPIKAEIRFIFPVLGEQGMYIVFHVNFMAGVRFPRLYHILRNLHAVTAFFSFNITEEVRAFYQNLRPIQFFSCQKGRQNDKRGKDVLLSPIKLLTIIQSEKQ